MPWKEQTSSRGERIIMKKLVNCCKALRYELAVITERYEFQQSWRRKNVHNFTKIGEYVFPSEKVSVGKNTYGTINAVSYGNTKEELKIGNYCSIAGKVYFILSGEHDYRRLSTYPFETRLISGCPEAICRGPIVIEDDVWIGFGCIVLSGVTIGKGAVIGAGSVITKDIPPYAVYAGNRVIKYRFSESVIEKIRTCDISSLSNKDIEIKLSLLQQAITDENVDNIIEKLCL